MFASIQAALAVAFAVINVVRNLLPDLIGLVDDVHKSMPDGSTAQKVGHVETILRASLSTVQDLPVSVDQVIPALLSIAARHFDAKPAAVPVVDLSTTYHPDPVA